MLTSKNSINVLGVAFDNKLNWQTCIENVTTKAKKVRHTIKLICKYLKRDEILNLITYNYFSILYYNSEIWHIPTNTNNSKKQLMSATALPLKSCLKYYDHNVSFKTLHTTLKRATPAQVENLAILVIQLNNY